MISEDTSLVQALLEQHPSARTLLAAYASRQVTSPPGTWLDRIEDQLAVEPEELSRLHGKLIAMGLLDFEVSPKGNGVRYQISTLGRTALLRVHTQSSDEDPADSSLPEPTPLTA